MPLSSLLCRGMISVVDKPAIHKDFQRLLASDVDAVISATPVFEHPRMLEAAVQARRHIYCEKPAGADHEGCRGVIAAGKRQDPKKNLTFGFQQRYAPVYKRAYEALQKGEIGEMTMARAYWIGDSVTPRPVRDTSTDPKIAKLRNRYASKEYSSDIIVEQDCHNFDALHWFIGARRSTAAAKRPGRASSAAEASPQNLKVIDTWIRRAGPDETDCPKKGELRLPTGLL